MVALMPIFTKAYWALAGTGIAWALAIVLMLNPTIQRHALYAHKIQSNRHNVTVPEQFGFAKGQVQPFSVTTGDGESLFCWHVLPFDVYFENEQALSIAEEYDASDDVSDALATKLLKKNSDSKVVVNFHGNAGHLGQGYRPSTYRSVVSIPNTHLLTCDYRGFGRSTLSTSNVPTESGLINDAAALLSYVHNDLNHPSSRTVLLGQSLGTAVSAAAALYAVNPSSPLLPKDVAPVLPPSKANVAEGYAGIILVAPFRDLPSLLRSYRLFGFFPILKPLLGYPRILLFVERYIVDTWPTQLRLEALLTHALDHAPGTPVHQQLHITLLHSRDDSDISFRESEALFAPLQSKMVGLEGVTTVEERRSLHGAERVKRGAFAYKKVEDAKGERTVELEVVRFGGHNAVAGWAQVGLAVRRAWERKTGRVGLDVE